MKPFSLRALLGLLFVMAGGALIFGATLFTAHLALENYLAAHPVYLSASGLLPSAAIVASPLPAQAFQPALPADRAPAATVIEPTALPTHAAINPTGAPTATGLPGYTQVAKAAAASLTGPSDTALPSPTTTPTVLPTFSPTSTAARQPTGAPATEASTAETPATETQQPAPNFPTPPPTPTPTAAPTAAPTSEPTAEPPVAQPRYSGPDPVVRLAIPKLKLKRAVVEIGLVGEDAGLDWDTDRLFNTQSRADLVGHLEGSAFPGEAGNIVLVGHNYTYTGNGVFVNLNKLKAGDQITLFTESDQEITYEVVKVKTVPYSNAASDLERHLRFLEPTAEEQLTLVTCGGANIGFFNKRVYVVAIPVDS